MSDITLGELQRFSAIASGVVLFLVGGVYWLHHQPETLAGRPSTKVVQVQLVPSFSNRVATDQPQAPSPMNPATTSGKELRHLRQSQNRSPAPSTSPLPTPSATPSSPAGIVLAGNDTISHFQEILSAHIGRFKRYPQDAVRERLQGTVQIVFVMNRGGELLDLWVDKSSGYDFFDKEAMETVRRAQPLPPIPPDLPDRLNIMMPVAFAKS